MRSHEDKNDNDNTIMITSIDHFVLQPMHTLMSQNIKAVEMPNNDITALNVYTQIDNYVSGPLSLPFKFMNHTSKFGFITYMGALITNKAYADKTKDIFRMNIYICSEYIIYMLWLKWNHLRMCC